MKKLLLLLILLIAGVYFWPQSKPVIPVEGASAKDWHPRSFWYYPWGRSVTHKGIDIFAKQKTPVIASSSGVVIKTGMNGRGGNIVMVLGVGWYVHYYAHLHDIHVSTGDVVRRGELLGSVGNTGNAQNRPAHLHYSIFTPIPMILKVDFSAPQGGLKAFFINPHQYLQ